MSEIDFANILKTSSAKAWNTQIAEWRAKDTHVDLQGADLRNIKLGRDGRETFDLKGIDLRNAHLEGADLEGVSFTDAHMARASLKGAKLRECYLAADLKYADFSGADLGGPPKNGGNYLYDA